MARVRIDPMMLRLDVGATTINSPSVCIRNLDPSKPVKVAWDVAGTFGGTSIAGKVQSAADNSTFGDIAGAVFTALTAAGNQVIEVLVPGTRALDTFWRGTTSPQGSVEQTTDVFIRVQATATGGTPAVDVRFAIEFYTRDCEYVRLSFENDNPETGIDKGSDALMHVDVA